MSNRKSTKFVCLERLIQGITTKSRRDLPEQHHEADEPGLFVCLLQQKSVTIKENRTINHVTPIAQLARLKFAN
jgi:hypothetical protein